MHGPSLKARANVNLAGGSALEAQKALNVMNVQKSGGAHAGHHQSGALTFGGHQTSGGHQTTSGGGMYNQTSHQQPQMYGGLQIPAGGRIISTTRNGVTTPYDGPQGSQPSFAGSHAGSVVGGHGGHGMVGGHTSHMTTGTHAHTGAHSHNLGMNPGLPHQGALMHTGSLIDGTGHMHANGHQSTTHIGAALNGGSPAFHSGPFTTGGGSHIRAASGTTTNYNTHTPTNHHLSVGQYAGRGPAGTPSILNTRTEYQEIQMPKKVMKEKKVRKKRRVAVEKDFVENEKAVIEIKEKIIEVLPPTQEVVEYKEKIVERKVKKTEIIEKKVPKVEYREKIVEVLKTEYVEVPFEKIVEVPQVEEKIVHKKVKVPQYVDRYVAKDVPIDQPVDVHRRRPKAVEAVTEYTFHLPHLKPQYKRKELPIYAPRFVEVPVPAELMNAESQRLALHLREQIHILAAQEAPSLCEIEKITSFAKNADFQSHIGCTDYQGAIENAWRNKQMVVQGDMLHSVGHNVSPMGSVPSYGNGHNMVYGQPF